MSLQSHATTPGEPPLAIVPPLEPGDCLSRTEFERRYQAMPWLKKAELVAGVVFVGSPVSKLHAERARPTDGVAHGVRSTHSERGVCRQRHSAA